MCPTSRRSKILLAYNGKTYSIKELSKEFGVPTYVIAARHEKNWPVERILAEPFQPKPRQFLTYQGVTLSQCAWAKKLGIRQTTISARMQVSWLNVPIRVNPSAPGRTGSADCWSDEACPMLKCLKGTNLEDLVKGTGIEYKRILYLPTKDEVDEALILKAVLEEDAAIVFGATVPSKITNKIMRRAKYWVVDGRRPEDPGGLLKGYQFSDRIFRWYRRVGEAFDHEDHMSRMHEATREKGRTSRRKYFIDNVVNGFAELVGVSRQRVVSKFLTDGIVDWLLRSVDGIRYEQAREAKTLLKARVKDAVRALEFYYRATEGAVLPTRPTRTERRVRA